MNTIDFLPERIRLKRERRRRLASQGCLLVVCFAALVVLGWFRQGKISQAKAELSLLQSRASNVQRQIETKKLLEKQLGELMIKKRIQEHLGSRARILDIMGELQRLVPPSMALTNLDLETKEISVPIASVGDVGPRARNAGGNKPKTRKIKRLQLVLTGLAPTDVEVANFIGQMSASPLLEDVNMGYARTVEYRGRTAREFRASCYVAR